MLPPLLADANVAAPVIAFLRSEGVDVVSIREQGRTAWPDVQILAEAFHGRRFVLTHDRDFGQLAVERGEPLHGILYLRPGDDPPEVVIRDLRPLLARPFDWRPPLLAVYHKGRLRVWKPPQHEK